MSQQIPTLINGYPAAADVLGLANVHGSYQQERRAAPDNHSSSLSSSLDNLPLPSPPSNSPEPLDAPEAQEQPSSLQKHGRVTLAVATMNVAYNAFWGTVRTIYSLPSRGFSAVVDYGYKKGTAAIAKAAAKKGIKLLNTPPPDSALQNLRHCLVELDDKVCNNGEIDPELRQRAVDSIDYFLADQKSFLKEAIHPTSGLGASLDLVQRKQFKALSTALKKNKSFNGEDAKIIKDLSVLIHQFSVYEHMFHDDKTTNQLVGSVTGVIPTPVPRSKGSAGPLKPEKAKSHYIIPAQPPEKPIPANPLPLIVEEIDKLKKLGFKIGLAFLVLPESSLPKPEGGNGKILTELIKKSESLDLLIDPIEKYQKLICEEIDAAGIHYVQKVWRKFACRLLAPVVLFIADHVLEQCKDFILHLIGLTPQDRLTLVVKMFIEPSSGFIDWLNCEYRNLAEKRGVNTTVDEAISDAIAEIKLTSNGKPLSPRGLINRLVGSLLAKYSPAFDWSSTATAHFEKRAHQSKSPFYSLWFMTWSYLAWAVNIISAPGRWCINKIIHKAVKIFVVWKIDSKLNAKDGSLDFGKLALSSVYKTLSAKLKIINRSDRSKEAEGTRKKLALEQTAFVDLKVQNDIGKLVFSFITLLYTRDTDLFHLQSRFAPGNIFEGPKFALMKIALSSGIQKATEQIIQGLQIFLEEKSFSVGILNVLENIREQSLDFNTNNASKSVGHHETYDQLRDTVRHGIQEIINDKLDPSKAMQDEADLFIDGLKSDIKKFNSQISAISDLTLSNLEELHELGTVFLVDVFRRRCERAEAKTNADARGHITTTKRKFSELGTPLYSRIEKLVKLAQNRKNFENLIKDLSDLQAPLEKATINEALPNQTNPSATKFYKELQLTLQIVRNKTYPEPVRLLITRLQGHFDTWKTETAKIDNQTILNGTISRLKSAIRQEIENNEDNIERATREIAEEFQQTRQLIASLNDWAKRLTHFKCVMEEQDIGALQQVLSRLAEDRASPLIFEHLNGFFLALGMNYNIKGILWYCIKAYLELPVKSPKEIKKILDKVKTKLQEPVSNSDFPT